MQDEYNIRQYIPKKYWSEINQIDRELDFDNAKNRSVNFYRVWLKNGDHICGIGLGEIKDAVKKYFLEGGKII